MRALYEPGWGESGTKGAGNPPAGAGAPAGGAPSGPEYPGAPYTSPGTPAGGGGFDADTYLQQNPDVAADFEQHQAEYAARGITTPQQAAAAHYEQYGKTEGRAEPMNPTTPGTPGTVVNPDLMNSPRPVAPAGPEFGPRTDVAMGDFGSAPDLASYFSHFEADPGAAYRRDQALDSVNAKSAARGMLRSGGAVKALATLGSDLASQEYNNWFTRQNTLYNNARNAFTTDRSFQGNLWDTKQQRADNNYTDDRGYKTGRWQYDVDRGDTNFNIDRGYQTDRGDTNTRNLFDLTRVGLDAAGNVSGAGTHFADSASSIYGNKADAASANYFNRAQANSYALNGVANAGANLFANWGGGARSPVAGGTAQNPYSVSTKNVRF
jgi:hypothetical protein